MVKGQIFKVASLGAVILGLVSCGSSHMDKKQIPAYFAAMNNVQQAQGADQGLEGVMQKIGTAFCGQTPELKAVGNDGNKETMTLKDCEANGIQTNGTLTLTVDIDKKENIVKSVVIDGSLNFKVVEADGTGIASCNSVLKVNDTASCGINIAVKAGEGPRGKTTKTGDICGLSLDDFQTALDKGTCQAEK